MSTEVVSEKGRNASTAAVILAAVAAVITFVRFLIDKDVSAWANLPYLLIPVILTAIGFLASRIADPKIMFLVRCLVALFVILWVVFANLSTGLWFVPAALAALVAAAQSSPEAGK